MSQVKKEQRAVANSRRRFMQLGAVFGLGGDQCGKALEQRPLGFGVHADVRRVLWHSWREPLLQWP